MRIWTRIKSYQADPGRPLVLALGNFDGVHRGHQEILKRVRDQAGNRNGIAAVLTFSEHPQRILHPQKGPPLLTSPQHRLSLFNPLGIELCFLLPFTREFAKIRPEVFVKEWLVECLQVKEVHLGYNAHFGVNRSGDGRLVKKLSKSLGFDFHEAEPLKLNGEFVSSSLIRRLIQEGDLLEAEMFLGRPFSIFASVVHGSGRGKSLGFPTANLQSHSEILPPMGVYPVELKENRFHLKPITGGEEYEYESEEPGKWRRGILNYGRRPTFGDTQKEIPEVFLFDFEGSLYGKTVEVRFYPRLREERQFDSPSRLAEAIKQDVFEAQQYFGRAYASKFFQVRPPDKLGP